MSYFFNFKKVRTIKIFLLLAFVASSSLVVASEQMVEFEPGEDKPGGAATHEQKFDRNSYSHASANISLEQELNFKVGNGFFRRVWISSPASTQAADGLGPLFNSKGCQRCHIKDGRGHPPLENEEHSESLLLRLSIPAQSLSQEEFSTFEKVLNIPDPVYGHQLQSFSIQGVKGEGKIKISYEPYVVRTPNGIIATLQRPIYSVSDLGYGPLHPDIQFSPRVAPQMIGLGLLEAIDKQYIFNLSDPQDEDADGISGKPNIVWSEEAQAMALGRFGHKAGVASINEQNQRAFSADIGISTPLFPDAAGDCTKHQTACQSAPHGNSPQYENLEVHSEIIELLLFYTRNLAVPSRRAAKAPEILAGKQLFYDSGCAACHHPSFTTARITQRPEHSGQKIWPYTDLLLHDMGQGLADNSAEGKANGREWRTAPLWGIGLTKIVNGHTRFLHDGRARNLDEAILWHDGEAAGARDRYMALSQERKQRLLDFVRSL